MFIKFSLIESKKFAPLINRLFGNKSFPLLSRLTTLKESSKLDLDDIKERLRQTEISSKYDDVEVAVFGLQDSDGNIIKLTVPSDQKSDFEAALGKALKTSQKEYEENDVETEIAEVIYSLSDSFDIIDVDYPEVEEDEEELTVGTDSEAISDEDVDDRIDLEDNTTQTTPTEKQTGDVAANEPATDETADETETDDVNSEVGADLDTEKSDDMGLIKSCNEKDILNKLLGMLTAQAEAKKEAAKAHKAKYAAEIAKRKMSQEERLLDIDKFYDEEKQKKKEVEKLTKLAKFRQDFKKNDFSI